MLTPRQKIKFFPIYLFSLLPFRVMHMLSDVVFLLLYYVVRYRKKVVEGNLSRSFPLLGPAEIKKLSKDFFRHFADLLVETGKLTSMSEKEMKSRLAIDNQELFDKYFNEGKSIMVLTAHLGNWEWLTGLPLFPPHHTMTFYQPLSSTYFDELITTNRQKFGGETVPSRQGYKALADYSKAKVLTVMCTIGDQSPKHDSPIQWVHFLNQDTPFLLGADRIARKLKQAVVFAPMKKVGRSRYVISLTPVWDGESEIAPEFIIETYAKLLEQAICEQPFMWLWSHKRWKIKRK